MTKPEERNGGHEAVPRSTSASYDIPSYPLVLLLVLVSSLNKCIVIVLCRVQLIGSTHYFELLYFPKK